GAAALGRGERQLFVPGGALGEDVRHGGEGLDVVDRGGHAEHAGGGGERRLDPRVTALPLDGVHERRLFAADVRPRAAVHMNLDVTEHTGGPRFGEGLLHDGQRLGELAADVDV